MSVSQTEHENSKISTSYGKEILSSMKYENTYKQFDKYPKRLCKNTENALIKIKTGNNKNEEKRFPSMCYLKTF